IPRPSQACKTNGKKTLPQELEAVLTAQAVRERPIRLMFQDEARFGRMARIRRCWAPAPLRPVVCNGYEREFTYVYGSVSPWHGELDWSLSEHGPDGCVFVASQSSASPGVPGDGGGRCQFAQSQGVDRAGECALDPPAGLFAGTQPPRAHLG